jgi:hypothetical protein
MVFIDKKIGSNDTRIVPQKNLGKLVIYSR